WVAAADLMRCALRCGDGSFASVARAPRDAQRETLDRLARRGASSPRAAGIGDQGDDSGAGGSGAGAIAASSAALMGGADGRHCHADERRTGAEGSDRLSAW